MTETMRRIQFGRDGRVTMYGSDGVIGILTGGAAERFTRAMIEALTETEVDHSIQVEGAAEGGIQRGAGAEDEGSGEGVGGGDAQHQVAAGSREEADEAG